VPLARPVASSKRFSTGFRPQLPFCRTLPHQPRLPSPKQLATAWLRVAEGEPRLTLLLAPGATRGSDRN
jgi:hypothetical protein